MQLDYNKPQKNKLKPDFSATVLDVEALSAGEEEQIEEEKQEEREDEKHW